MVTTRRSTEIESKTFETTSTRGGVDLLERPRALEQVEQSQTETNSTSQSEKMRQNLYNLLNYDRFTEENMQVSEPEIAQEVSNFADEDIRPTSTTMQFGDDIEQIREEMKKSEVIEESAYHLNAKGKVAVILYSLVVTVILALIVLNTGILATFTSREKAISASLNEKVVEYNQVMSNVENISSPDYIIDVAQNQYGMVNGN
ncbi:MAG: hypothetical protein E7372_05715 [Clostridiales bacterium]|nr:hypothetical protein [Clostridiales bacterium]